VFVIAGGGTRSAIHQLRLAEGIRIVPTPRHAAVLLLVGTLTDAATDSITQVHDQMAGPRVTIAWGHPEPTAVRVRAATDGGVDEITELIRRHFRNVVTGVIAPEPRWLPDVDQVEWRGVGPYGHGGAGMTGGTPYGRPLALRAPARDGLELDVLPITVGPWFPGLPAGLALRISFQGDIAQVVEVIPSDLVGFESHGGLVATVGEPMLIRDLEMARARRHLEWMADTFRTAGVDRAALVAGRIAATVRAGDTDPVDRLVAAARRSLLRPMSLGGVGILPADIDLSGLGPVARAAGADDDLRACEPAYRELGFEPVNRHGGDAWARFEQRAAEAVQALELAARAGDRRAFGDGEIEGPDGRFRVGEPTPAARLVSLLERVLTGMEWGDLVTTVQSLDIDMDSVPVRRAAA
jgi:Respiratory-chain NADH dehydrogenase, 49 Kd subunit